MADIYSWTPEQIANAQTFFAGNPTPDQIYQTANQYGLNPSQVSSLWSQATGGDYNTGLQAVNQYQTATGQTLAGGATPTLNQQAAQDLITQAYAGIGRTGFGDTLSTIDKPGFDYWTGQLQSGALAPEQFQSAFSNAVTGYMQANPNDPYTQYVGDYLVNKGYKDVLNRAPEAAGSDYWKQQIISGAIPYSGIAQVLAQNAQGLDRIAAQKYLGQDVWAPASYLQGTSGLGYQDVVNYVNANLQDPTNVYMASQKYGVDPNEILQAYQSQGTSPYTLQQIQDYLNTGKAGYETKFNDIVGSVFGSGQNLTDVKNVLYANYANQVKNLKVSDNTKNLLLQKETPDTLFEKRFGSSGYSAKSFDDIRTELQNSSLNKLQDAYTLSGIAQNALGYTPEDASALINKAMSGKLNTVEQKIYDSLLKNNAITGDDQTALLSYAAVNTPNAPIFKNNPNLLTFYTPIQAQTGTTGQYGYYNNAPILNAKFIDKELGDSNSKGMDVGAGSDLGWATSSRYQGRVNQGLGLFGIDIPQYQIDAIKKTDDYIKKHGGLQSQQSIDPETGQPYTTQGVLTEGTDPDTGKKYTYFASPDSLASQFGMYQGEDAKGYSTIRDDLSKAASKIGIDPTKYSNLTDLYNAVNDKTKNLYQVTGRTGTWDPAAAASVGTNHASVLYQRVGDKLVPVSTPQGFNFDDPKRHGWLKETLSSLGPILPFAMMAASIATGGLSNLLSPLTAPVAATLTEAGLPSLVASSLTNAAVSGGLSALTGGDWQKAGLGSLVSNLVGGSTGWKFDPTSSTGYKPDFIAGYGQNLLDTLGYTGSDISNLISPTTLARIGGTYAGALASNTDPSRVLINQAISQGFRSLPGTTTTKSGFEDTLTGSAESPTPQFTLSDQQKAQLEDEYNKIMASGSTQVPGITGLPLGQESQTIDAMKEIIPLLMAKGLTKSDAMMLASNLLGATLPA